MILSSDCPSGNIPNRRKMSTSATSSARSATGPNTSGSTKSKPRPAQKRSTAGEDVLKQKQQQPGDSSSSMPATGKKKMSSQQGIKKESQQPKKPLVTLNPPTVTAAVAQVEEDEDGERCIVCCERMDHCGLGECGHRTCCGLCTFRLRQLHKDEKCVLCKSKLDRIFILPVNDARSFDELSKLVWNNIGSGGLAMDEQCHSIWFAKESLSFKEEMDTLREARCGECTLKFPNVKLMEKHLLDSHGKQLCKLCLEFRGLFLMEHRRMTPAELNLHCKSGDGTKSFEGHPSCKFCKGMMFYNSDQLYKHLNEAHESCHLCAKSGNKYQYFRDYKNLEMHFEQDHFVCDEPRCREAKFVAFLTELQLQAHMATEHPEKLDQRTSALNLDFVVRGSRRFTHGAGGGFESADAFRPSRSPSPPPDATTMTRMAAEDFPRLHHRTGDYPPLGGGGGSRSGGAYHPEGHPGSRRYAQTTASNVSASSMDQRRLFAGLKHLAGPSAEQEVRSWCARLVSGLTTPKDFYEYMFNLLGEVTLNIVFEDIQVLVGPDLARKLEEIRRFKTGVTTASAARWDSSSQSLPAPLPAPSSVRLDDASAFPSLSRPASSSSNPYARLSRAEVRDIAFGNKKPGQSSSTGRMVSAPVGAKPAVGWKRKEDDDFDRKLDVSGASSSGKNGNSKQSSKKKSDREKVMEMAVKFGQ